MGCRTCATRFELWRDLCNELLVRSNLQNTCIIQKEPKFEIAMVNPSTAKAASTTTIEKVKRDLKESKVRVAKLEVELSAAKEGLRMVTCELEKEKEAKETSELNRKKTEEALQKKEEEHKSLLQRLNSRVSAPQVVEKELTETQRTTVGTVARKIMWVKYKLINDISFRSGEIFKKCFEEMNVTSAADQKSLERSIKLEYSRSLSQHKYHVKNGIMSEWKGKYGRQFDFCVGDMMVLPV